MLRRNRNNEINDHRKDYPDPKDPQKGIAHNNYGPITCLLMIWKIQKAQICEEIYCSPINCGLLHKEQKGCRKGTRETGDFRYIYQHTLMESETRQLAMARIDNKKVIRYGLAKLYNRLSQNVQNLKSIENTMKNWRKKHSERRKSRELYSREMCYHHYFL